MNHGNSLLAGSDIYLWVRKNVNDSFPLLNVAVTMGKIKDPLDPIHSPPFHGYKRCPGMVNKGGLFFAKDVYLWYRKRSYETDVDINDLANAGNAHDMNQQIIDHVRTVLREHCMEGVGKIDLEKGFMLISDFGSKNLQIFRISARAGFCRFFIHSTHN